MNNVEKYLHIKQFFLPNDICGEKGGKLDPKRGSFFNRALTTKLQKLLFTR